MSKIDPLGETGAWRQRGNLCNYSDSLVNTAHCLQNALEKKDYAEVRLLFLETQELVASLAANLDEKEKL